MNIALLSPMGHPVAHVKKALSDAGISVVWEAGPDQFNEDQIRNSGARVILVNLDPDADAVAEQMTSLLQDERRPLIFNDAVSSSRLEGWDQARWARHLVSKITGQANVNPPVPAGAEPVPVRAPVAPAPVEFEMPETPKIDPGFDVSQSERVLELSLEPIEINEEIAEAANVVGGIRRVWVLGASIGGPEAVRAFLAEFPADFPCLFVLAQHMGTEFIELMAAQLAKGTPLKVVCAEHGAKVRYGQVIVVPVGRRFSLERDGITSLGPLPGESPYSPSIDLVLKDIADKFGSMAGSIIFSGMASDAIEGAKYLVRKGGVVWAQDPDSCVIASMVDGVRAAGIVSFMGSPEALAKKFIENFSKPPSL